MKKTKSVSEQLKNANDLGSKVAKIMNVARSSANKILAKYGYGVNINVDFYRLDSEVNKGEVLNG